MTFVELYRYGIDPIQMAGARTEVDPVPLALASAFQWWP